MNDLENQRRRFFKTSLMAGIAVVGSHSALARTIGGICQITPAQTEGPFYPIKEQPDEDNDLTFVRGGTGIATGKKVYIIGKLTDEHCAPVAGALVEIWQACASGRYNHPNDTNTAPLDPNFQYWGKSVTDEQGRYSFKTILPGAYPADTDWVRPPHVHFKVHKLGFHELTTQMYFAGHPLNEKDRILLALPPAQRKQVVIALENPTPPMDPDSRFCRFDLSVSRVNPL